MLYMVRLKGCRRCGGDLFLESDSEGVYISCLQCGAIYNVRRKQAEKKHKKVAVH
jgi:DNA-directed RNA polymerase subunit M/transcription elongation factor TFIIS